MVRQYITSPSTRQLSPVQAFQLPPAFAKDEDTARRKRVYEDLLSFTLERRLRDKARGPDGGSLRAGREMLLLSAVSQLTGKRARGESPVSQGARSLA